MPDLRVLTNNFDAEYGNFSGGQVLVTTKSGSNKFTAAPSNSCATPTSIRATTSSARAAYNRNQYGGTLGGPIHRNKAFFFLDYQGTRMTQGRGHRRHPVPTPPTAAESSG